MERFSARAATSGAAGWRKWRGLISSSEMPFPLAFCRQSASSRSPVESGFRAMASWPRMSQARTSQQVNQVLPTPVSVPVMKKAGMGGATNVERGTRVIDIFSFFHSKLHDLSSKFSAMFKWLYGPILISKADRLGTYAAALAYCFVLSMVPFLAVTFAVGLEISTQLALGKHYAEHYAEVLSDIIPMDNPHDTERIFAAVQHSTQGGRVSIGFIRGIYTSFNLREQIIRTINFIFDDPRRPQEWSWTVVAKTFVLLLIWLFLFLVI